jgi:Ni2+-binding GTPase involved in maturation of urease and hydrogenase
MRQKVVLFCGAASSGKTQAIVHLSEFLRLNRLRAALCKLDCIHTSDDKVYEKLGFPYTIALSDDLCPDHFLVSNLEELVEWSRREAADFLIIETAGLCHRCCPATKNTVSVCVLDSTSSLSAPEKLGPMLATADAILITKIDMVSQAEREIIAYNAQSLNPTAEVFCADGTSGYGMAAFWKYLASLPYYAAGADDKLRHTMPAAVCSYCVGERRIGVKYQQGVVKKIFKERI